MINPMELTGKHILITGGSSGIGRQCAIQASKLGAKVTIIARREDALKETISMMEAPEFHAYYAFDLSQTDQIEDLIKTVVAERGAVDGFVHAAGIGDGRTLKMSKPAHVEKMFRLNTFAFFECVRCLGNKNNMNELASVVGISSVAAETGNVSQGIYSATKAAMNGFLSPIAKELGKQRIRINTVAYAMVDTPMFESFMMNGGDQKVMERQFLGVIDVVRAANCVMFLLSNSANYITGAVIPVYAGYN